MYAQVHLCSAVSWCMQGETFNAPEPCPAGASLPELVSCVQQLLNIFVANGFAIKVSMAMHQVQGRQSGAPCTATKGSCNEMPDLQRNIKSQAAHCLVLLKCCTECGLDLLRCSLVTHIDAGCRWSALSLTPCRARQASCKLAQTAAPAVFKQHPATALLRPPHNVPQCDAKPAHSGFFCGRAMSRQWSP